MTQRKIIAFKKILGIKEEILGITFSDIKPAKFKFYRDTACTILARAFSTKKTLLFGKKNYRQLCPGADYFLKFSRISQAQAIKAYIEKECVFKNKNICRNFLNSLPKPSSFLKNKFIIIKPLASNDRPAIVLLLTTPAQTGRILGLLSYSHYRRVEIFPCLPTCFSFFFPLTTSNIHLNFIDYYDRYYQGKAKGKSIWPESKMIVSMESKDFEEVLSNLRITPYGNLKPKLRPVEIDSF